MTSLAPDDLITATIRARPRTFMQVVSFVGPALLVFDVASLLTLTYVFVLLRTGSPPGLANFTLSAIPILLVFCSAIYAIDGYRTPHRFVNLVSLVDHLAAGAIGTLISVFIIYVILPHNSVLAQSRASLFLSLCAFVFLSLSYRRIVGRRVVAHTGKHYIVFVGPQGTAEQFRRDLLRHQESSEVYCAPYWREHSGHQGFTFSIKDLGETIQARGPACIALVTAVSLDELQQDLLATLISLHTSGVPVLTREDFYDTHLHRVCLTDSGKSGWILAGRFSAHHAVVTANVKRVVETGVSVLLLVLLSPLLVALVLCIKLDGGPAIFKQRRIGLGGKPFTLYKFRSMQVGAEVGDPYTRANDNRITRVGRFLRRSRLDELPQLLNVLKGDMSLVGPRAEWDLLTVRYEKLVPCYHLRHLVRPGITGLAQISYGYGSGIEDAIQKLEYDLYYVKSQSIMLDIAIIIKTIYVMASKKGI